MKYCDSDGCEAEANQTVQVSIDRAHDGTRHLCHACYQAYLIGVQHGRFHEAAVHHTQPNRASSQLVPYTKEWHEQHNPPDPKESTAPSFQEAMKDQWSQWPS